jgi:hypothetical protein
LREQFTLEEVVELGYVVMWFSGLHRVNALFEVERAEAAPVELGDAEAVR